MAVWWQNSTRRQSNIADQKIQMMDLNGEWQIDLIGRYGHLSFKVIFVDFVAGSIRTNEIHVGCAVCDGIDCDLFIAHRLLIQLNSKYTCFGNIIDILHIVIIIANIDRAIF